MQIVKVECLWQRLSSTLLVLGYDSALSNVFALKCILFFVTIFLMEKLNKM